MAKGSAGESVRLFNSLILLIFCVFKLLGVSEGLIRY